MPSVQFPFWVLWVAGLIFWMVGAVISIVLMIILLIGPEVWAKPDSKVIIEGWHKRIETFLLVAAVALMVAVALKYISG